MTKYASRSVPLVRTGCPRQAGPRRKRGGGVDDRQASAQRLLDAVHDRSTGRQRLGELGESLAADHLRGDGLSLLARNWRSRHGELDIVAREPGEARDTLVFCEVKTRRSMRFGPAAQAVVGAKAARIRRLSAQWMAETGTHLPEVRFDVVSVLLVPDSTGTRGERRWGEVPVIDLEHLCGAF